ncbi:tryptophan--tRNA ligase [Candidatus Saccharibacteria bacterium HGW-Saccharibacteria-1]|jgi:tryptophanyl-tRNA synthetase|nr:MAG: tryptophan--tRNA ligase [Candidatus Saccharibacteria bacterium HGW-Saccharibacteria-1]
MTKPVILTGIRANNDLTIGNYFGAILPIIDMAKKRSDEFQINMFIPDLHSFTTSVDHDTLNQQIINNARLFVAAGLPLDNDSIYLYRQSYIPAHSELTWVLDCFTGFGEMERMTQFKEKSGAQSLLSSITSEIDRMESISNQSSAIKGYDYKNEFSKSAGFLVSLLQDYKKREHVSTGLFNYPVLMAADILLYNAKYVPVGEDQSQHLEFTRDIAERMNNKFDNIFTVPEAVKDQNAFFGAEQGLRTKDLVNPTKKMSKSDESGRGVIFLGDDPEVAYKKVMGATTDDLAEIHFDKQTQPGISNLLEILALVRGNSLTDTIAEFEGQTRYGDFKKVVATEIKQFLSDFQKRLSEVDNGVVMAKLEQSERDLTPIANATLLRAQQAVGLRPKAL